MPLARSPVRTPDGNTNKEGDVLPPTPDQQLIPSNVFVPPSARLAAVTRKGNEILELMNNQCKDKNALDTLFKEYLTKVDNLHIDCEKQELDEVGVAARSNWLKLHSDPIVNTRVTIVKYINDMHADIRGNTCSVSSVAGSATSSTRARLAEQKAKLAADRAYNDELSALQDKIRKIELEKRGLEQKVLENELNKLDNITNVLENHGEDNTEEPSRYESKLTNPGTTRPRSKLESDLLTLLKQQHDITLAVTKQSNSELPKKEIHTFDGSDITKFPIFMRSFTKNVHENCTSDVDRLHYLEQFTSASAREIVKSCNHSDATRAYTQAIRLLDEEYGNEYKIAAAYLEKLENWPEIRGEDGEKLKELSTYLLTCYNSMDNMTTLNQLNSPKEIMAIVLKLPYDLRRKWRNKTQQITEANNVILFSDLVNFVRTESKIINQPVFGSIQDSNKSSCSTASKRKSLTTQVTFQEDSNEFPTTDYVHSRTATHQQTSLCSYCKKPHHELKDCYFFKAKPYNERVDYIKRNGLCFGCLKQGHNSRGCTRRMTCAICAKKHPTLLHCNQRPGNEQRPIEQFKACSSKLLSSEQTGDGNHRLACAVLPIKVKLPGQRRSIEIYASLDTCSTSCFMDERLLQLLNIKGAPSRVSVNTVSSSNCTLETKVVNNLELYDMRNDLQDIVPVVFAQRNWPFSRNDTPKRQDFNKEHLAGIPYDFIDADVSLILGINRPNMVKPLDLVDVPARFSLCYSSSFRMGHQRTCRNWL